MEYRNRTSSNPSGIFSHRFKPVRYLYEPCDVHQAWWTAHLLLDGARRPVVPSTVRRPYSDRGRVSGAPAPACGRLVPGRINGDLDITL